MNTVERAIEQLRERMGPTLFILGHFYQDSAVLRHVDAVGDSLELARRAAACKMAEKIVFCGVRFMAETADMLTLAGQTIFMPDSRAGCPMADMATVSQAEACAARLAAVWPEWVPIVYVNSSAAIKAFCGRRGGSACTSSNATRVFRWALDAGKRILFLPDQHLGVNTAHDLKLPDEAVSVYDPLLAGGGLSDETLRTARVAVWKGFCHVHRVFTVEQVFHVRARHPAARIIVHPETPKEVVRLSDFHGSTSQLIDYVRQAPEGSEIFIGTENHLVQRLADEEDGRVSVHPLFPSSCPDMSGTTPESLLAVLEDWPPDGVISVPPSVAGEARLCLERMLAL